jgi:hypothetical protein
MSTIKALTVCNPWGWAMLNGPRPGTAFKKFENRDWHTDYVGPLVIHAGKSEKWMREGCEFLRKQGVDLPGTFEFGMILGVVYMVGCVRKAECGGDPYAFGSFCFVLENPRRLARPIPYVGKQGFFYVDRSLVAELLDDGVQPIATAESKKQRLDRAIAAAGADRVHLAVKTKRAL